MPTARQSSFDLGDQLSSHPLSSDRLAQTDRDNYVMHGRPISFVLLGTITFIYDYL